METSNTTSEILNFGFPLAFNRQYLTILIGYIEPPFILIGTLTNSLAIIGIGTISKFNDFKIHIFLSRCLSIF